MRTSARITGAAAAAVAAALLVTGCGSDSGGSDEGKPEKVKETPADQQSSDPAAGDASGTGAYLSGSGSKAIALYISGKKAALVGEHTCSGAYANNKLMLKCADGNTDRAMGTVDPSADGKSLKVDWDALPAAEDDTFVKIASPSGVPTDLGNVPTDIPTDIPTDFPTDIPTDIPSDIPTDLGDAASGG